MKELNSIFIITALFIACSCSSEEVTIGKQVWMTENLNVVTFRNGDPVPEVKSLEDWLQAGKEKKPAWCYYDNDSINGVKYGKLYNWYAVNDPRGLAPEGWRISSYQDWNQLESYLGDQARIKLKSSDGWTDNGNGTNKSGFSARPSGMRNHYGKFDGIGSEANWWTTSKSNDNRVALSRHHYSGNNQKRTNDYSIKSVGMSIRCLKDSL